MKQNKLTLLFIGILLSTCLSGCIERTLYPAVNLTVEGVDPYESFPSAGAEPTEVSISLKTEEGIPSNLEAFSIAYYTRLGEPISKLEVPKTAKHQFLPAATANSISITPYTAYVLDLYELSSSDISPIRADITLYVKDVNGNRVERIASCLLYKPKTAAATTETTGQ